jgi:hypothetical protein
VTSHTPRTRIDQATLATARILENLAELLPQAREHAVREIVAVDSYPTSTHGASMPTSGPTKILAGHCARNVPDPDSPDELIDCGQERPCAEHDTPVTLTAVERAAEVRLELRNRLDDIDAQMKLIAHTAHTAVLDCRRLIGVRAPVAPVPLCRDAVHGKDMSPELYGEIINCIDPVDKGGHCARHYYRLYRERREAGRDVGDMHEPGAA